MLSTRKDEICSDLGRRIASVEGKALVEKVFDAMDGLQVSGVGDESAL
jgi:hypothetical protein